MKTHSQGKATAKLACLNLKYNRCSRAIPYVDIYATETVFLQSKFILFPNMMIKTTQLQNTFLHRGITCIFIF